MMSTLAFWYQPHGSGQLWTFIIGTLIFGIALIFGLTMVPPQMRRGITWLVTFISGLFYILLWLWPRAQDKKADELPNGFVETVSFKLTDAVGEVAGISTIITAFLLLMGVFSLVRMHSTKIIKQQKDWGFSICLLLAFLGMVFFGYWDWLQVQDPALALKLEDPKNWGLAQYGRDFLFNGVLQQMDAAMFSVIAFYILSAAYRAFRIRSVEATILLASAILMMLSLLPIIENGWGSMINGMGGFPESGKPSNQTQFFLENFKLSEIAGFIRRSFQGPSLRAIDFGIGIGAVAMGLRLWLGLEKGGVSN